MAEPETDSPAGAEDAAPGTRADAAVMGSADLETAATATANAAGAGPAAAEIAATEASIAEAADPPEAPTLVVASLPAVIAPVPTHERVHPASFPNARVAGASGGPLAAYEALARAARLPDLVAITQKVCDDAAGARRSGWNHVEKVTLLADEAKLPRADADTPFGNVLKVLGSGPEGEPERALAAAIWAHAIAEARRNDEDRLAGDVLWLATHTAFDATPLLDRALGEDADELWIAIAHRVRRIDEGKGTSLGRGEAIVGAAALSGSSAPAAQRMASELSTKLSDPTLVRLLAGHVVRAPSGELRLEGEATAPPRGPILTTILALTGILFAIHAVRFVARVALAYRRPAEISVSDAGVRMKTRTEMLGRVLREREHVIVRAGLEKVVREVRYPRAAFYAGLLALATGSYIGVRAFSDGVRAASPSLLLTGLVVIILGVALDFVLGSVVPSARGRVRLLFIPRTGATLAVMDVDAARADDVLKRALAKP